MCVSTRTISLLSLGQLETRLNQDEVSNCMSVQRRREEATRRREREKEREREKRRK
jgi:hypothetical protein